MTEINDLKELLRAEMGILNAKIETQGEDIREIKQALRNILRIIETRRERHSVDICQLKHEQLTIKTQQKVFLGGLAVALAGAVKGFFDLLFR
ncbi:MAG: hypothetical protein AB1646_15475 [Thermodesulfobacteriota bacterium]